MPPGTAVEELPTFAYLAVTDDGERVNATMQAPTEDAVRQALHQEGWTPIRVDKQRRNLLALDMADIIKMVQGDRGPKLKTAERAAFARQFYQLLKAGIPPGRSLAILAEDAVRPDVRTMLEDIADQVTSGTPLAEAFGMYERAFDSVFVAYLSAGEATGTLELTLKRLAKILEKRNETELRVKGVTMYPKMVSGVIGLLVFAILKFIVPKFAAIYNSFGAALPGPTQFVVSAANKLPLIVGVSALLAFGAVMFLRRTKDNLELGKKLDKFRFKLPIFGRLSKKLALYRWTSTMAGALDSGVHMSRVLDLSAQSSGSRWIRLITPDLQESVQSGAKLSDEMQEHSEIFTPTLRNMASTGEEAGELPQMLDSAAETIDDEIDMIVSSVGAKIEVGLLVVMGGVVGAMLVALYLPILQLTTTAGESMGF